ncbi:MAG: hypothetical protein U9Q83_02015 [Bacteroidota bacterium]|nr:hypothetical protein [Bacteroidota bacterium]
MEKVNNKFQTLEYNSSKNLLTQTWKKESKKLDFNGFKKEMGELINSINADKPKKVLIDMQNFFFVVGLEEQTWVNTNVNSLLAEMEDSKTAYIMSPDLFAAVSVEQTLDESEGKKMGSMFFKDANEAEKWLFE